ncbi:Outer membrane protein (porin)-like protein [Thioalkalivibrio sp. K90mix]|uniref:porin n=1 Tax=Thioalkalivibrio sp. (strain K90mix) TaxID=396595 RepID=UPI000195A506|nr:porin [Thioalkalivibrio sp. K90mix]ADC72305.1 Outer membrane protein (porin)-like protein [Thioalkalivibrio sp. K90mix]
MKKQILAVAVAGAFAVPAFAAADSSVTLFGQLQTQIVHHSGGPSDFDSGFRVHDAGGAGNPVDGASANRLGVMVDHDLGNGLSAIAKFEQDFNTSGGDAGFNSGARDIYVGLDGNFGRVIAGRMASPFVTAGKDPLNGTFMQARTNGGRMDPQQLGGLGEGNYLDRGIQYSNSFGIMSMNVAAFVDNADDSNTAYAGRLNFDLNPVELYVAGNWADDYSGQSGALDGGDFRAYKIGADWRAGPFRLVGEATDFKWKDEAGETTGDGNTYFLSGTYTMGRNDFVLNLGHTRNDDAGNVDYAAIAVKHNFSNRVMAFAGVSYADYDDDAPTYVSRAATIADGNSFTGVGGGLRVSF